MAYSRFLRPAAQRHVLVGATRLGGRDTTYTVGHLGGGVYLAGWLGSSSVNGLGLFGDLPLPGNDINSGNNFVGQLWPRGNW